MLPLRQWIPSQGHYLDWPFGGVASDTTDLVSLNIQQCLLSLIAATVISRHICPSWYWSVVLTWETTAPFLSTIIYTFWWITVTRPLLHAGKLSKISKISKLIKFSGTALVGTLSLCIHLEAHSNKSNSKMIDASLVLSQFLFRAY